MQSSANLIDDSAAHTLDGAMRDLIRLRNIEIVIQGIALAVLARGLHYPMHLLPLALTLSALGLWNLWSWWRLKSGLPGGPGIFFAQMLPDIAALTIVFYHTGGATNPFVWIYLFPLVITATALPRRYAWMMVALTVACYSLLMFWYIPLPGSHMGHRMSGFNLHIQGMWLGFVLSAVLFAYFIGRLADSLRERDRALAQAREKALQNERVVALGALAAGAAHELGTPLATIALLADEIAEDHPPSDHADLHAQLQLISQQVRRCKTSLSVLSASSNNEMQAHGGRVMAANAFLDQLTSAWRRRRPTAHLQIHAPRCASSALILADETLRQAIGNVLDNAADVSPEAIELQARCERNELRLTIADRGPGGLQAGASETNPRGLGLGLFLAYTTLQRLGGEVLLHERDGGGTLTEILIPLAVSDD